MNTKPNLSRWETYTPEQKQRHIEKAKEWRLKNPEKRRAIVRKYREDHADHLKDKAKAWRAENKDKVLATNRKADRKARTRKRGNCKEWQQRQRQYKDAVKMYYGCLNLSCLWEGEYTPDMLDFHHVDSEAKAIEVSKFMAKSKLYQEINKCSVLCANCHRRVTSGEIDDADLTRCHVDTEGRIIGAI